MEERPYCRLTGLVCAVLVPVDVRHRSIVIFLSVTRVQSLVVWLKFFGQRFRRSKVNTSKYFNQYAAITLKWLYMAGLYDNFRKSSVCLIVTAIDDLG